MNKRALLENLTPEQRGALIGSMVGAGGMGLAGAMGSKKNKLRNSLLAALAGGAGGAGLGYFAPGLMGQGEAKEQAGPQPGTAGERGEVGPKPGTPGELGQVGPSRAEGLAAGKLLGGGDSQKATLGQLGQVGPKPGTAGERGEVGPSRAEGLAAGKLVGGGDSQKATLGQLGKVGPKPGTAGERGEVGPKPGTAGERGEVGPDLSGIGRNFADASKLDISALSDAPKSFKDEYVRNPIVTPFKELQPGSNLPAGARASNTSETPEAAIARRESDAGHERALKRDNYAPQRDASGNVVGYGPKRPEYITGGKPQPKPGAGLPKMVGGAGFGNPLDLSELMGTYNQLGGR
jgi:hypothetical protein